MKHKSAPKLDYQTALEAARGYRDLANLLQSISLTRESRAMRRLSAAWYRKALDLMDGKAQLHIGITRVAP